jgi:hypothetical protein
MIKRCLDHGSYSVMKHSMAASLGRAIAALPRCERV